MAWMEDVDTLGKIQKKSRKYIINPKIQSVI